jgi:hypothetical protein
MAIRNLAEAVDTAERSSARRETAEMKREQMEEQTNADDAMKSSKARQLREEANENRSGKKSEGWLRWDIFVTVLAVAVLVASIVWIITIK